MTLRFYRCINILIIYQLFESVKNFTSIFCYSECMTFKDRLREEIEYQGLLVKEVSSAVGISNSTFLSYIDSRAVMPNVETAVKIAQFLGVSVEYLVTGKKSASKQNENAEKIMLLKNFENLSKHDKNIVLKIVNAMSEEEKFTPLSS